MLVWRHLFVLFCSTLTFDVFGQSSSKSPKATMPTETTLTEVTQSSTKLSNATTPKEVTTTEVTQSSTKLPNATSISELTEATTTVSDEDHSHSNIDGRDFRYTSTFEKSLPFFSNGLIARLRAWNKVLNNATTQCEKVATSGTPIAKYLEIEFVDFRARYVDAKDDSDNEFLTLETFHPVLMRQQKDHDLVSVAYMSILELWPLLVLCFSCAALSGMIIWLLDHRSNPETFSRRFWKGFGDGMWWAIVTMTTVGYGDKAPKSWLARLFGIVWMIAGIVLLSMFTAQVSSRLTAQELKSEDYLFNKKIGVPPVFKESHYTDYQMPNSILIDTDKPIISAKSLKAEGLDSVVVFHCNINDKDAKTWEALRFLPLCDIGATFFFKADFSEFPLDAEERFFKCLKSKVRSARKNITELKRNVTGEGIKSHSCREFLKQQDILKFRFKWVYFSSLSQYLIPFGALMGAIVLAFIFGSIYDYCSRENNKRKSLRRGENSLKSEPTQTSCSSQKSGNDYKELMTANSKV